MPWKNGGGETTEIAVFPENAGLSDFDWRVSMAKVEEDGPFSAFAGIDRTLSVLEGAGIVLSVEGAAPTPLTRDSKPHSFPADVPTSASLIDGAVFDFNVMTRRGKIRHAVMRLHSKIGSGMGPGRMIFCGRGSVAVVKAGGTTVLDRFDAILLDRDEPVEIVPADASEYYLVEFRAAL